MALRELYAKFTFDWDQGTLVKIERATQAAEATVGKLAEGINHVSQVVRAGTSPMQQYGLVQENGSLAAGTLLRMHEQLLRRLEQVTAAVTGTTSAVEKLGLAEQKTGDTASAAAKGLDKTSHAAGGLRGAFKEALAAFGVFGGVFGAVFAGHALKEAIVGQMELADSLQDTAAAAGVSVEAMQTMYSVVKSGGIDMQGLAQGVRAMAKNIGLLTSGAGGEKVKKVLSKMGLGVADLRKQSPEELFFTFGKAIASIEDPVQKSAFAQRVFGQAGAQMLDVFKGAPEDIDRMREAAIEAGTVFSTEFAEQSEKALLAIDSMGKQFKRIRTTLIASLLPVITWGASKMKAFGKAVAEVAQKTSAFQGAFLAGGWMLFAKILARLTVGGAGVIGWVRRLWPLLLRIGRVLLPWLAWTLILDDIITFLQGGDSALGRLLDRLGGAGTAARVLDTIKEAWHSIGKAIVSAGETLGRWFDALGVKKETAIAGLIAIGLIGASGIGGITISLIAMIARLVIGTAMWAAHAIAIWAANAAGQGFWMTLLNVGIALGAIMMAAGGLALMVDQFIKLKNEAGGLVGILKGLMSMAKGEGFFKGVDEAMNEQARKDAANRAALERDQAPAALRSPMLPLRPELMPGQVPPMLARPGAGAPVAVTDNRTLTVNVTSPEMLRPEVVGRKIAGAVTNAQPSLPNLKAAHGALAGAPHG